MSEVKSLIAGIKSQGLLRAGAKLELLYVVAAQLQEDYAALKERFDFKQNLTEQIVELKAQRDALAAENAALTSACRLLAEECAETAGEADITMQSIKTPATDAHLNSVRAEGVEICISSCDACVNSGGTWYPLGSMREIARKLRSGEPS